MPYKRGFIRYKSLQQTITKKYLIFAMLFNAGAAIKSGLTCGQVAFQQVKDSTAGTYNSAFRADQ